MSASETGGSVERVRSALLAAGHPDTITQFPAGTRTAADAAAAVGCTVAQIAKSIVFRCGMRAAVVITSGANRVDQAKAEAALGVKLGRADADWVRQATGFAIGGVAPVGHLSAPMLLLDDGPAGARSDLGGRGIAAPRVPDVSRGTRADYRGEGGGGAGRVGVQRLRGSASAATRRGTTTHRQRNHRPRRQLLTRQLPLRD